ncbi:MAG TPA: hypothetical protein VM054_11375 [bacterium]|nr:hypothetical protein [bacterium]
MDIPNQTSVVEAVKGQLSLLADPRRWRIVNDRRAGADARLAGADVETLWHHPPQTHLLVKLSPAAGDRGFTFYLPLLLTPEKPPAGGVPLTVGDGDWFASDPFLSPPELMALLKSAGVGNAGRLRLDSPSVGPFAMATRNPLFKPAGCKIEPLLEREGEPSTNYLYRLDVRGAGGEHALVAKRYLPREEPGRGDREWELATALSSELVPRPVGRLADTRSGNTLVGFYEFVPGVEVGLVLWKLYGLLGVVPTGSVLARVRVVFAKSLRTLASFHDQIAQRMKYDAGRGPVNEGVFHRAEEDLRALRGYRVNSKAYRAIIAGLVSSLEGGGSVFHGPRPVHGDLMWRQVVWRMELERGKELDLLTLPLEPPEEMPGRLTVMDAESWRAGYLEEDLAGLAAADNFMLALQERDRFAPVIFAALWHAAYQANDWDEGAAHRSLRPLLSLIRLRHLHDAAYYAGAKGENSVKTAEYDHYVRVSLHLAGLV